MSVSDFEKNLEGQVRKAVKQVLDNYPNEIPYVPEDLVDDLTKLALEMY